MYTSQAFLKSLDFGCLKILHMHQVSNTAAISLQTSVDVQGFTFFNKPLYILKWKNQIQLKIPKETCVLFSCQCLEKVCLVTITLAYISQTQNKKKKPMSLMVQTQQLKWVKFEISQVYA